MRGGGKGPTRMSRSHGHFRPYGQKLFVPHVPFDLVKAESSFTRVKPAPDDKALNEALLKRNQDLTPNPTDQTNLLNLVTKTQTVLDNLLLSPGDFDACHLDEVRQVGSFKKGTMMINKLVADICVILKTLPTKEAVTQLANKVVDELKKTLAPNEFKNVGLQINDFGFEIIGDNVAAQVLVTTQQQNLKKLEPELHMDAKICQRNLASIKHSRWFDENASHSPSVKVLIRLLKDMRNRFEGLQPLNPWIIDLTAHYVVLNNPKHEQLALNVAFRRIFQIISAGFFLPGSAGFIDPCEQGSHRVHTSMTLEQQDVVCFTFQTLLRVLTHGGYRQILGLEGNSSIATTTSVWAGVVITPSDKAYEPKEGESKEGEIELEDNMEMN